MLTLFRASTFEDWTDIMTINMYGCDKHFFYQSGTPALLCDNAALGYEPKRTAAVVQAYSSWSVGAVRRSSNAPSPPT